MPGHVQGREAGNCLGSADAFALHNSPGWQPCCMKSPFFIFLLVLSLLPLATMRGAEASPAPARPNILLIVGDDIGWGDIGCYGSTQIQTPNLDRLASEGVRLSRGYVTAALCSPSRAAILTGRYQEATGQENNWLAESRNRGLDLHLKTLADVLGDAGYATGLVGKWHEGVGLNHEFIPTKRGFQEFFGFYSYGSSYTPSTLIRGDRVHGEAPVPETRRTTVAFAEEACAFIDRHGVQPFFLEVAFNAAHEPLPGARKDIIEAKFSQVTDPNFPDSKPDALKRRQFCALVTELDEQIGVILAKLKEKGVDQNTLIVYLSDNGGWIGKGGNNGPLRGGKWGIYEGGQRVPFIWRWPGHLPAGKVYGEAVSSLDLLPTFAAVAGAKPPKDLDGMDVLPYLLGERSGTPNNELFWKLNGQWAITLGQWKAIRYMDEPGKPELYDLGGDLSEKTNVVADHPDKLEELNQQWDRWNATLPPAVGQDKKVLSDHRVRTGTAPAE